MHTSNIQNLRQLEPLGYNLQCNERPIAMIYESYRKYSMYYILLFREIGSMYFRENMLEFSADKTDIRSIKKYINGNEIENYIAANISANKKMLFFSDHFWNREYPSYYQIKHYKHPLLLQAINDKEVTIIDEDIERILREGNKYYSWPYVEKKLELKEFEKICRQWTNNNSIKQYEVLEFSTYNTSAVCLEDIISDYSEMIKYIKDNFLVSDQKFYDVIKNHVINEETNFITERGLRYIYNHTKAINRQYRLFLLILQDREKQYEELYNYGKDIKDLYEMYYLLALKNKKFKGDMWEMTEKIYLVEKRFYNFLFAIVTDKSLKNLLKDYASASKKYL